jgi:hypothetical protein
LGLDGARGIGTTTRICRHFGGQAHLGQIKGWNASNACARRAGPSGSTPSSALSRSMARCAKSRSPKPTTRCPRFKHSWNLVMSRAWPMTSVAPSRPIIATIVNQRGDCGIGLRRRALRAAIIDGTGPHDATVTALAQAVPYRWHQSCRPSLGANAQRRPSMISSGLIIVWLQIRVPPAPPRSPARIRFPGAGGIVFNFPGLGVGQNWYSSPKMPARSLPSPDPFPAGIGVANGDRFDLRQRRV